MLQGPLGSPWSDAFTHTFIHSGTQEHLLSLYKPWPGLPGPLSLVSKEHTGTGESGAVGGAGCRHSRGAGGALSRA